MKILYKIMKNSKPPQNARIYQYKNKTIFKKISTIEMI